MSQEQKLMDIADTVGVEEVVCQLAEECTELAKAALKYRRVLQGTAPISEEVALVEIAKEIADVQNCIEPLKYLLENANKPKELSMDTIIEMEREYKVDRWYKRTFGANYGKELGRGNSTGNQ